MESTPKKILAIIPARGGSKGIRRKNVRLFAGKPLIAHAIDVAKNSPSVDRIIVSTEDEEIAAVSKAAGAEVPFLRPAEFAQDQSKLVDAIVHLLEKLKTDEGYVPSHILLLQPTNPLRTSEDVEKAVRLFDARNAESLVSLCATEQLLLMKDENDVIKITNPELLFSHNRQELPATYRLDGSMIYLISTKTFLETGSFLGGRLIGYEVEPWRSVDLDEPEDFVVGEHIFKSQDEIRKKIDEFS